MGAEDRQKRQRAGTKISDLKEKELSLPLKRDVSTYCNLKGNKKASLLSKTENVLNGSILPYLEKVTHGRITKSQFNNLTKNCIINQVSRFKLFDTMNVFKRRVTTIAWHPVYRHIAAAGSKGGDLVIFNLNVVPERFLVGIGSGGSIVGLAFNKNKPNLIYTTSITGCVKELELKKSGDKTLISNCSTTEDWFSSLDVCHDKKFIMLGDTAGYVNLITDDGLRIWCPRKRLHKNKVTHVEFSMVDPNIFVTASLDRSVKLWDLRNISESVLQPKPFLVLPHEKAVNSAYFSPSNGQSLLTTDQHSEIRIYKSPHWTENVVIHQPHRHFQHLTPIKAIWHPLADIILVGRYPDEKFEKFDERTIDFYDGSTGNLLHRKATPANLIAPLNAFNITGDTMISAAGTNVAFWEDRLILPKYSFIK